MRVADSRNIFRCGPKRHGGGGLADGGGERVDSCNSKIVSKLLEFLNF